MAAAVVQADYEALDHLFELYDERTRLMRAYRKERLVLGSTGQIRINPCLDAALRLDKQIADLEGSFGITPLKRSRLGLSFAGAALSLEELNRQISQVTADNEPEEDQRELMPPPRTPG